MISFSIICLKNNFLLNVKFPASVNVKLHSYSTMTLKTRSFYYQNLTINFVPYYWLVIPSPPEEAGEWTPDTISVLRDLFPEKIHPGGKPHHHCQQYKQPCIPCQVCVIIKRQKDIDK